MEHQRNLIELQETFQRLLEGLNAMNLMALGLMQAKDPYADGINVLCVYLQETADEAKRLLTEAVSG